MAKKKKEKSSPEPGVKVIARNKRASHRWAIEDTFEAGLELLGTEVKSLRAGLLQLSDAYAAFEGEELFLYHLHIGAYPAAGPHLQHDPLRRRKLLLHRAQLERLRGKLEQRGYSLIPLELRFRGPWAKVIVGLGRGKKQQDRREDIREREADRDMARALRRDNR
ncbi:MAG: SsrA-binding protein SmpB [Deltaproteobacteria bacterium]|nr:SsrA-binding protein SmpB [Deltaproteobacteria bacterium]